MDDKQSAAPKVSVIVNCFNGDEYLKQALDSIYAQSFTDWEIIFFDNNSTDTSAKIANSYDSKLIYYKNSKTISLGHARKEAVTMTRGEWIAFLDVDDFWLPQNLETQLALLEGSKYVLSYAGIREIKEDGSLIRDYCPKQKSGYIFPELLIQFDINMVTPLIKKQALLNLSLNFDPIITASEEYNLFMRIAAKGNVNVVPQILGVYRVGENSLTNKQISKWGFERQYTLNQLIEENPGINDMYQYAFNSASNRGLYYEARYQMYLGNTNIATKILKDIRGSSLIYFSLYALSFCKPMWDFFHSSFIKRKIALLTNKK